MGVRSEKFAREARRMLDLSAKLTAPNEREACLRAALEHVLCWIEEHEQEVVIVVGNGAK